MEKCFFKLVVIFCFTKIQLYNANPETDKSFPNRTRKHPWLDLTWWILGRPPCGSIGPRWGCLNAGRGQLNAGGQLRAGGGRALWRCRMEPVFKNMNGVRMHYIRWQGIPFQYSPGKKGKFIWILMGSKSSVFIIMGGSCSWVCFP